MRGPHDDCGRPEGERAPKAMLAVGIPCRRDDQRQRDRQAIVEETEQKGLRESEGQGEHGARCHPPVRAAGQEQDAKDGQRCDQRAYEARRRLDAQQGRQGKDRKIHTKIADPAPIDAEISVQRRSLPDRREDVVAGQVVGIVRCSGHRHDQHR